MKQEKEIIKKIIALLKGKSIREATDLLYKTREEMENSQKIT